MFVVVAVVIVVLAFVVDVASAELDVVISAAAAIVFHFAVALVLFEVAPVASDFENDNGDLILLGIFKKYLLVIW